MDITHPKDVQPSTTSKPVIVTNRPMVGIDPMIAGRPQNHDNDDIELPASAHAPEPEQEVIKDSHESKTIVPTEELLKTVETSKKSAASESHAAAPSTAKTEDQPAEDTAAKTSDAPSRPDGSPAIETEPEEPGAEEQEDEDAALKPETAEQKRQRELEEIVASGKYFVPINRIGKRRAKIALIVLFCVLAALLVFDVLLDMQIVHWSGVPHTTFFSL